MYTEWKGLVYRPIVKLLHRGKTKMEGKGFSLYEPVLKNTPKYVKNQ